MTAGSRRSRSSASTSPPARRSGWSDPDAGARRALLWMIAGYVPPATGRILVRGHVAPLFNAAEINVTRQTGERAVKLDGHVLPLALGADPVALGRDRRVRANPRDHRVARGQPRVRGAPDEAAAPLDGSCTWTRPLPRQRELLCDRAGVRRPLPRPARATAAGGLRGHPLDRRPGESRPLLPRGDLHRQRAGRCSAGGSARWRRFAHERPKAAQPGAARAARSRGLLVERGPGPHLDRTAASIEIELDVFAKRRRPRARHAARRRGRAAVSVSRRPTASRCTSRHLPR